MLPFLLVSIRKHFFASALSNRPKGKPLTTVTPVNTHIHEFTHPFPNPKRTNRTYSEVSGGIRLSGMRRSVQEFLTSLTLRHSFETNPAEHPKTPEPPPTYRSLCLLIMLLTS